jgi:5-methylcytosine-specific restriction endonuclease McrA
LLTREVVDAIRGEFSSTKARDFKGSMIIPWKEIDGKALIQCDHCGEVFFLDEITVHHTVPVIPPQITYKQMSFNMLYTRLYCSWKDLELLCLPCHQDEGHKEDQERQYWKDRKKQLVCRSRMGGKMRVNPVVDLDNLDPKWEVMDVARTRTEADSKFRRWRKN